MKERYRSFYPLSDDEEQQLWEHGAVVLDTNVLLGLYRQSPATRKTFATALEAVADRLWMPHQVGLEFHRNRESTRRTVTVAHGEVSKNLRTALENTRQQVQALADRDHLLKTENIFDRFDKASRALKEALDRSKERFNAERKESGDPVLELVERLYPDDRIGEPFQPKALSRHRRRAVERFAAKQPPGFADAKDKTGDRVFGDYFLWVQAMHHARSTGVDVILVSEDRSKGDWIGSDGAPLPALRSEFHEQTGHEVLIVDSATFLEEVSHRITNADEAEVKRAAEELQDTTAAVRALGQYAADAARFQSLGENILSNLGAASLLKGTFADLAPSLVAPGLMAGINSQFASGWGDLLIPPQASRARALAGMAAADLFAELSENHRLSAVMTAGQLAAQIIENKPLADEANAPEETDAAGEDLDGDGDEADTGDRR